LNEGQKREIGLSTIKKAAKILAERWRSNQDPDDCPPSLAEARQEFDRLKLSFR